MSSSFSSSSSASVTSSSSSSSSSSTPSPLSEEKLYALLADSVTSIQITGNKKVQDGRKDPFIVYVISVATSLKGVSWETAKRYSQFEALHKELQKLVPKSVQLPALPPKHNLSLKRTLSSSEVDQRKEQLNAYLCALMKIDCVLRSRLWLQFLQGTFIDLLGRLKQHIDHAEMQDQQLKEVRMNNTSILAQMNAAQRQNATQVQELENKFKGMAQEVSEVKEYKAKAEEYKTKAEQQIKKLKDDLAHEQTVKSDLAHELDQLKKSLASLSKSHEEKLQLLQQSLTSTQELNNNLTTQNKELTTQNTQLQQSVKLLKTQKKILVKGIKDMQTPPSSSSSSSSNSGAPPTSPLPSSAASSSSSSSSSAAGTTSSSST
eukprot:TRINITY_DN1291_c0_g1_i1.p1 TRINITY_DN1291_c0_g1~~TRINITY_DN1291_c0_g1_i1.p1  ORF type:complete len:376 (+),score=148.32 TRINITY_DN1291_c0_g1_i1:62-1189(+)